MSDSLEMGVVDVDKHDLAPSVHQVRADGGADRTGSPDEDGILVDVNHCCLA